MKKMYATLFCLTKLMSISAQYSQNNDSEMKLQVSHRKLPPSFQKPELIISRSEERAVVSNYKSSNLKRYHSYLDERFQKEELVEECLDLDISACKRYKEMFEKFYVEASQIKKEHDSVVKQMEKYGRELKKKYENAPEYRDLLKVAVRKYESELWQLGSCRACYSKSHYWGRKWNSRTQSYHVLYSFRHLMLKCFAGERPTAIKSLIGLAPRTYCDVLIHDFNMKPELQDFEWILDDWIVFLQKEAREK